MICERCGKEFMKDYRKYPKGIPRFCSCLCARKRIYTQETKDKISKKVSFSLKEKWKNKEYREKVIRGLHNNKESILKAGNAGRATQIAKRKEINENLLIDGKYELMSFSVRRKILFEEANYSCEVCNNKEWLGESIWLEIHHKDSNNKNNKRDNLIIVCPNCHSIIDKNYRFRGRKHNFK